MSSEHPCRDITGNWSRRGCVRSVFGYGYGWDWDGVLWMGSALSWEREQRAAKDDSLRIAAPYETKSFHETRGIDTRGIQENAR